MPSTHEPSIEELREQSERSREALAATVGELRTKVGDTAADLRTLVSPAHIKQEVKNYIRDERESVVQAVQRRAKENPLQMAAIGAAVAYPAWSLLRAIPTPLMLIGAGLFLTSSRGQQAAVDAKAKLDDVVQQGTEKVLDITGSISSDLEDRIAGARYGAEEVRDGLAEAASSVTGKARAAFRSGVGVAGAAKAANAQAADTVAAAAHNISAVAADTADSLAATAGNLKDRAASMGKRSRNSVATFVTENPLLVAGIGAAVGAFIAASIPPSAAENQMFGAGSDALKNKAREAAADGVERAGDMVSEAAGSMAAAAAREGLDGAGVQRALNSVAESVRAVADRGLDTALSGAPQTGQNQKNQRTAS